jgi:tRNA(fMet)-specific endonuclease VapC
VNKVLLDTDTYSEVRKAINSTVVQNATTYRRLHSIYTNSVITVMEVVQGYQRVNNTRRLQAFSNSVASEEVISSRKTAAELAGRIAGDLERTGQPIGRADPMIAAIALENGLELATGNTSHYQRVQQLGYPLNLVNWRI